MEVGSGVGVGCMEVDASSGEDEPMLYVGRLT